MNQRAWWKEAVVYQIYPRSFQDSDGDGIGDLSGIISRLDYLKELGVNVLWLSPIYKSPNRDNGYDISDYQSIMDEFGTMNDFDCLLDAAHQKGLKIIMDLVVNHTSDQHPWFLQSKKSADNPYRDYYVWRKGPDGREPNNWGAIFGGSAWEFDSATDMYYLHMFAKEQPDLNWENAAVRKSVYDMMRWWCDKGIDGFRMDVIGMLAKDQRFLDAPKNGGLYADPACYVYNQPKVHERLKEMRREVLSKYDLLTVGETSNITVEDAWKYAGETAGELNMVFQFEHVETGSGRLGKWTTQRFSLRELRRIISKWQTELEGKAWNSNYWGNHDQARHVTRFGNDSEEYRALSAKLLATCQFMLKGTPYIYQGEELGMTNAYFDSLDDYRDLESIQLFHEYTENGLISEEDMMECLKARSRDNARTPMQWDDTENASFSKGIPWIRVNPNYRHINASAQVGDTQSVYNYYRRLIRIRQQSEVILYGSYELLLEESDHIWAYRRVLGKEQIVALNNFSADTVLYPEYLASDGKLIGNYPDYLYGQLRPYECIVFYNHL